MKLMLLCLILLSCANSASVGTNKTRINITQSVNKSNFDKTQNAYVSDVKRHRITEIVLDFHLFCMRIENDTINFNFAAFINLMILLFMGWIFL
ncbi:hypothetical protein BGI36_09650 [Snodgrassella communis]|jgi:hypothetical protein|nr:hypothetical protein BGI36_09650 [Snodgrassella communis]